MVYYNYNKLLFSKNNDLESSFHEEYNRCFKDINLLQGANLNKNLLKKDDFKKKSENYKLKKIIFFLKDIKFDVIKTE